MSTVTDIILTTFLNETSAFNRCALMLEDSELIPPVEVSMHGSLGKAMQQDVYIGAYNRLDLAAFVEAVEKAGWQWPEMVRLFINEEHDECGFHEVQIRLPGERRR